MVVCLVPIIAVIICVIVGYFALKWFLSGRSNFSKAKRIREQAKALYLQAQNRVETARKTTAACLESLGRLKLNVWGRQFTNFINIVDQIKDVELSGNPSSDEFSDVKPISEELMEIKQYSLESAKALQKSIDVSVATKTALYGASTYTVTQIGTASTGIALSSLHGAALSSATLAWFGGGSLAVGGLGMAGGAAVLGGITIVPAIAVGGYLYEKQSRVELAKTEALKAKVDEAVAEMDKLVTVLNSIQTISDEYQSIITRLDDKMTNLLSNLKIAIKETRLRERSLMREEIKRQGGVSTFIRLFIFDVETFISKFRKPDGKASYILMTMQEKRLLHTAYETAQIIKKVLETPLLDGNGNITELSNTVLQQAKSSLE